MNTEVKFIHLSGQESSYLVDIRRACGSVRPLRMPELKQGQNDFGFDSGLLEGLVPAELQAEGIYDAELKLICAPVLQCRIQGEHYVHTTEVIRALEWHLTMVERGF